MQNRHFSVGMAVILSSINAVGNEPDTAKDTYFEKEVRPILVGRCYACHSAETKPAGMLRVDDEKGLLTGGNSGPAIVPGKPNESLFLKRVAEDATKRMPAEGEHLDEDQIAVLTKWIADGAVWPVQKVPPFVGEIPSKYESLRNEHWAWQPLSQPQPPTVQNAAWPRDDLDQFILAKLGARLSSCLVSICLIHGQEQPAARVGRSAGHSFRLRWRLANAGRVWFPGPGAP